MTPPGARDLFVEVNGLRLHLLDWGGDAGPPILCVHANGYLAAIWQPIALALTSQARVLGLDLPGHGDSEPAPDYRWDHLAEYVGGVLRALDLGPGAARRALRRRGDVGDLRRALPGARAGDGAGRPGDPAGAVLPPSRGVGVERLLRRDEASPLVAVAGGDAGVAGSRSRRTCAGGRRYSTSSCRRGCGDGPDGR